MYSGVPSIKTWKNVNAVKKKMRRKEGEKRFIDETKKVANWLENYGEKDERKGFFYDETKLNFV